TTAKYCNETLFFSRSYNFKTQKPRKAIKILRAGKIPATNRKLITSIGGKVQSKVFFFRQVKQLVAHSNIRVSCEISISVQFIIYFTLSAYVIISVIIFGIHPFVIFPVAKSRYYNSHIQVSVNM